MPSRSTGVASDPVNPWYACAYLDVCYDAVVDADGDGVRDAGATAVEHRSWGRIRSLFRH